MWQIFSSSSFVISKATLWMLQLEGAGGWGRMFIFPCGGSGPFSSQTNKSFLLRLMLSVSCFSCFHRNVYDIVHVYKWNHQFKSDAMLIGEENLGNLITISSSLTEKYCRRNAEESWLNDDDVHYTSTWWNIVCWRCSLSFLSVCNSRTFEPNEDLLDTEGWKNAS